MLLNHVKTKNGVQALGLEKCIAELTVGKMAGLSTELDILEPLNSGPSVVNAFLTNLPNELVA